MGSRVGRTPRALVAVVIAMLPVVPATATPGRVPVVVPELDWQATSAEGAALSPMEVRPYGLVVGAGFGRSEEIRSVADGSLLREGLGRCSGVGPVGADVAVRARLDEADPADRIEAWEVHLLDERTGAALDGPVDIVPTDRAEHFSCTVLPGPGDQAVVRIDGGVFGEGVTSQELVGLRVVEGAAQVTWRRPACLLRARVDGDVLVLLEDQGCADPAGLEALDMRTGEVLARTDPIGRIAQVRPAPSDTTRASVLVPGLQLRRLDLVPAPGGWTWVEAWRTAQDEEVGEPVHLDGDTVVAESPGGDRAVVDLATGAVVARRTDRQVLVAVDEAGRRLVADHDEPEVLEARAPDGAVLWRMPDFADQTGALAIFGVDDVGPDGSVYAISLRAQGNVLSRLAPPGAAIEPSGVLRTGAAADPVVTANQLCQRVVPDHHGAARVVVTRDDVFADALSGAALAGPDGCVIHVEGGPDGRLGLRGLLAIARVLPAGGQVHVLGGEAAVSSAIEADLRATGFAVTRLAGSDRVATAGVVAREVAARAGGTVPRVYLATAGTWVDAVTASAVAAREGAPILLSATDELSPATATALEELGVGRDRPAGRHRGAVAGGGGFGARSGPGRRRHPFRDRCRDRHAAVARRFGGGGHCRGPGPARLVDRRAGRRPARGTGGCAPARGCHRPRPRGDARRPGRPPGDRG